MTLREQIGAEIQRIREEKGLNRTQAAEAAEMNVNAYRGYERGEFNITVDTIERLCRAINPSVKIRFIIDKRK